jgi:integrase
VFNFALGYDPQPLLDRNPFGRLGLTSPEAQECVWLERNAAVLVLECLSPWYRLLAKFLLSTGVRWGEAAALQVKDVHLGDGTEHDPAWIFVHKTWKRLRKLTPEEAAATGKTYEWGRGRTKTAAGRRRITLHPSMREELLRLVEGRDLEAPVFTGPKGGILNSNNFTERALVPALRKARELLAQRRAAATPQELLALPREIPEIRPHAFRHTHAAWLLSAGRSEAEVQRRLGHADPNTTKKLYGHLTEEVSKETIRFLQVHLASIMMVGHDGVVSAAEDRRIDTPDAVDAALPLVDADEDGEEKAAAA